MPDINPLIKLDYPDPDVIRVDDTYYMVSTTMHFMPGCEILRSYDLIHWEHASYVYEKLDSTPAQCLLNGENAYGKGMWAATIRYHKGTFYIVFVCNDTQKTYLFTSKTIDGPWNKSYIDGFYHDCSLLFDDDDRIYIAYGNRTIHLTELTSDLKGPKEGGVDRVIVEDSKETSLGYEGSHFYKINGKYYIFFIHSLVGKWFRAEACYVSDSIEGEFTGGDIFVNDMGYLGSGVAQGGIVDTPDGDWYGIFFQDRGAVGRIPVLVPMTWENDYPKMCDDSKEILNPKTVSTRPGYEYAPLFGSDDFKTKKDFWQFNHEPDLSLVKLNTEAGYWSVRTSSCVKSVVEARNTLTQRLAFPATHVEVTVDATLLNDGDYAGLVVLQGAYAFVGVTKDDGKYYVVMKERICADGEMMSYKYKEPEEIRVLIDEPVLKLSFNADFMNMKDEVRFGYSAGNADADDNIADTDVNADANSNTGTNIGPVHKMYFKLDHFTGNRAGLFMYSTKEAGGEARFSLFTYVIDDLGDFKTHV